MFYENTQTSIISVQETSRVVHRREVHERIMERCDNLTCGGTQSAADGGMSCPLVFLVVFISTCINVFVRKYQMS